jgi:heme exporter protein A
LASQPANDTSLAIDARGVARRFGARWVLRGISFRLQPGEIVGLLGANGSGKSTLLRIFGTLLKASAGEARVYGSDVAAEADAVRAQVGFLAHTPGLYDDLTARENVAFAATMLGLPTADIDGALARVGLAAVANERVRGFSAGMQRRLGLARLLLRRPRLLLLDEPYSNLDAAGIELMNEVIVEKVRQGGAALVVLHELAPAAGMLDRTVTIVDGRVAQNEREHDAPGRRPAAAMGAR